MAKYKQAYKAYSRDNTLLPKLIDFNDYSVIGNNDQRPCGPPIIQIIDLKIILQFGD